MPPQNPPTWIGHISKGQLIYHSEHLINSAHVLEKVFNEFHKDFLSDEDQIFKKVALEVNKKIPEDRQVP